MLSLPRVPPSRPAPAHNKYAAHAAPRESERKVFVTVRKTVSDPAAVAADSPFLALCFGRSPARSSVSASRRARNDGFNLNILAVVPIAVAVAGGAGAGVSSQWLWSGLTLDGRRDGGTEGGREAGRQAKVAVAR